MPRAIASKLGQKVEQKGIIKSGAITFAFETGLIRMFFEQVESQKTQDSEVLRRVIETHTRSILGKGDIQSPMEGIFNGPMGAGGIENTFGIGGQTGQK